MAQETTSQSPTRTTTTGRWCCRWELVPWRAVLTVGACMMMEATLGVTYTNGNVMPYLTSYLRNVTGETWLDYSDMLWVGNSSWLVMSVVLPFLGLLDRKVPRRLYLLTGILFNAAVFFGTYWAVQTSYIMLILVYGVLQGLAQAVLYPVCVIVALEWFPHRKGLVAGLTMGGYGGGAFMWNQVVTRWINPRNLKPDLMDGENLYFGQDGVLSRVPTCFLVLGGILISVQLVCVFSMSFSPSGAENDDEQKAKDVAKAQNNDCDRIPDKAKDESNTAILSEEVVFRTPEYTPLQILTSRAIWTLFLNNLSADYAFIFIVMFYKAYGQTFIHNDHLLALVASFAAVFNAVGRPIWGLVADRIGYLPAMLLTQGILVVTSATFLTTELTGSTAMYFVWVCAIFAAFSGIYSLQGPILVTLFGPRYFVFSLGVLTGTAIISTLSSVPLAKAVLAAFNWKGLFLFASASVATGVLTLSSLLVSCGHPIPQHMRTGLLAPRRHQAKA